MKNYYEQQQQVYESLNNTDMVFGLFIHSFLFTSNLYVTFNSHQSENSKRSRVWWETSQFDHQGDLFEDCGWKYIYLQETDNIYMYILLDLQIEDHLFTSTITFMNTYQLREGGINRNTDCIQLNLLFSLFIPWKHRNCGPSLFSWVGVARDGQGADKTLLCTVVSGGDDLPFLFEWCDLDTFLLVALHLKCCGEDNIIIERIVVWVCICIQPVLQDPEYMMVAQYSSVFSRHTHPCFCLESIRLQNKPVNLHGPIQYNPT